MCCLNLADKAQVRVTERLKSMQATQDSPDTRLVGTAKLRQAICRKKTPCCAGAVLLICFAWLPIYCLTTRDHKKPLDL